MPDVHPEQWHPGCAACSRGQTRSAPYWTLARLSSERRGRNCFIWVGDCPHSQAISPGLAVVDDPADWTKVAAAWCAKAAELFAQVTTRMSPRQRDELRQLCYGETALPGATIALPLDNPKT